MTYIGVEEENPSVPASNGLILALGRHVRRRMAACDALGPFRAGLRSTDNWGAGQPERRAAFVNAKERGVVGWVLWTQGDPEGAKVPRTGFKRP